MRSIDGFEVACAKAQDGFEDIAVAALEFQAAAVEDFSAFAQKPFFDAIGAEGFSAATEAVEQTADPWEKEHPTDDACEAGIERGVEASNVMEYAAKEIPVAHVFQVFRSQPHE